MSDVRDQLLMIFAAFGPDRVHESDAYCRLCERHAADRTFLGERAKIERTMARLERCVSSQDSYQSQVRMALEVFVSEDRGDRRETCRRLIECRYTKHWNDAQRRYFAMAADALGRWQDYFLSFTNRNPTPNSDSIVNTNHRHFIQDTLGSSAYRNANLTARNMLAAALHYKLRNKQFEGFYYPEHEGDSQLVETKLTTACQTALVFIQLVQSEMFVKYDDQANYCHFEYRQAKQRLEAEERQEKHIVFVMADPISDLIPANRITSDFKEWYSHVKAKDVVVLIPTRRDDVLAIDQNHERIRRHVIAQIDAARAEWFDNVPA